MYNSHHQCRGCAGIAAWTELTLEVLARAHRQMKLPSPRPRKSELEAQVLMALDVEEDISRLQKRSTFCLGGLQISVMILQEGPRKVRIETLGRSIPGRRSVCSLSR